MTKELLIISFIFNVCFVSFGLMAWFLSTKDKKKNKKSNDDYRQCKSCGISAEFSTGYCLGCEPEDDDEEF